MKAIVQDRYESPDNLELRDVATPIAGDDDVLVRVHAASLHPDVWHVVSGRQWVLRLMGAGLFRPNQPIPGTDMSGIVESVGKNVRRFRPGDAVFGETITSQQWVNGGALADYVAEIPPPTKSEAMSVLGELLESGRLTPIIDSTFPLSEARTAFRHMIEDELRGKVVITVAGTT